MYKNLTTPRLTLRPLRAEDKEFILELLNTEGWLKYIGNRHVNNPEEAGIYIRKILDNPKFFYTVFESRETRTAAGIITLLYRETQKFPDLGFAMLPQYAHKGFATEATHAYLNAIKSDLSSENILAITLPDNKKSIRLIEKSGFCFLDTFTENNQLLLRYILSLSQT